MRLPQSLGTGRAVRDMAWMLIASLAFTIGVFTGYDSGVKDAKQIDKIIHTAPVGR